MPPLSPAIVQCKLAGLADRRHAHTQPHSTHNCLKIGQRGRSPSVGTIASTIKIRDTDMDKLKIASKEDAASDSPSRLIDAKIEELGDWRGETLARVRMLIRQAVPGVSEELKWRGVPVWEQAGIICTGETYKNAVKLTFAKGASLDDPAGLFNSSLEGNTRRAIDIHEGEQIDAAALQALVRAAVELNMSSAPAGRRKKA
jgi:hypothetical protein